MSRPSNSEAKGAFSSRFEEHQPLNSTLNAIADRLTVVGIRDERLNLHDIYLSAVGDKAQTEEANLMIGTVALFEFQRVFKMKDVLVTLVIFCVSALALGKIKSIQSEPSRPNVGVVGNALELEDSEYLPFRFLHLEGVDEEQARNDVKTGELETLVIVRSLDDVEIVNHEGPQPFQPQLQAVLSNRAPSGILARFGDRGRTARRDPQGTPRGRVDSERLGR